MLSRRIKRDVTERGRDVDGILEQWVPRYGSYSRTHPYLITDTYDMSNLLTIISWVPRPDTPILYSHHSLLFSLFLLTWLQIVPGSDNAVAIELISTHIRRQLKDRSNHFRKQMASSPMDDRLSFVGGETAIPNLILLPQTHQLKVETSHF
jgi:uridine kinase